MKKTVTANISGIVFHIDEDAYEKLSVYLDRIREKLSSDHGRDEILSDIEGRIAEMFQEKLTLSKKVITIFDVKNVIEQLGEPEQFEEEEEQPAQKKSRRKYDDEKTEKRLYRDPDDKYIGGVAGGLAAFFNIDTVWIRVAFILFTFVYGFGPLLYIILWIVVPKARTTAEKLEMRGEKVNLSNIEKSIREELNELKNNIKEFSEETKEHFKKKDKSKAVKDRNAQIAANALRVFAKFAGVILIFLAFAFIIALISGIYLIPVGLHHTHGVWLLSVAEILTAFLSSTLWVQLTMASLIIIVGVPIFWMLLTGVQLLFDIKTTSRYLGAITFILWLAALGTIVLAGVNASRNFFAEHSSGTEYILEDTPWPNLYIQINEQKLTDAGISQNRNHLRAWRMNWQEAVDKALGMPQLRIKASTNNKSSLEVIREARGISPYQAGLNAANIEYSFIQKDSLLILDPVFYFDKEDGWRNQKVILELNVPEEKIAILQKNIKRTMQVKWNSPVRVVEQ